MSVGVDEMSWDDYLEDNYEWTSFGAKEQEEYLAKIFEYRHKVQEMVLGLLDTNPVVHPIVQGSLHWVILMGIEHENIHLETSAVIIAQVEEGNPIIPQQPSISPGANQPDQGAPPLHLPYVLQQQELQGAGLPCRCPQQHTHPHPR